MNFMLHVIVLDHLANHVELDLPVQGKKVEFNDTVVEESVLLHFKSMMAGI